MTLHMLQLVPDLAGLTRWAEARGLLDRRREDDFGYALHAVLQAAFGTLAPAPFALLRQPTPRLLAYGAEDAAALRDHMLSFAEPDVAGLIGLPTLASKPMPDLFTVGRRLGFSLRARPTIRTDRDGDRTKVRERDAFLAAIEGTEPNAGVSRGEVYQAWLSARLAAGGAAAEHVVLDGFRRSVTLRRDRARRLHALEGPDAQFSGVLRVTDPAAFAGLLARGVGRHGAFGYGMLLLKPA
jgi:CRISPR system Cascade subunit CasE